MVEIPLGSKVTINLWDNKKRRGLVKYIEGTQHIVDGRSDFNMNKGDTAWVIKSSFNNVVVVPDDRFIHLVKKEKHLNHVDYDLMAELISTILKEREEVTGGFMSIMEIIEIFQRSTIKFMFKKDMIEKSIKKSHAPLQILKENNVKYINLTPESKSNDIISILNYAQTHEFVSENMLQTDFGWSVIRIMFNLRYLVDQGRCRKDESYRSGVRYYFINI